MSNPNPFVPKGSLLELQSHRRSRLKLAVFCVLAVSVTGLVAMLIQGCKRTPPDDSGNNPTMTDSNTTPSDLSSNSVADTNSPAYVPPMPTNAVPAYVPPAPPPAPEVSAASTEYVVVAGDTLAKIAKANGVSLKALEAANPGVDPKRLHVKQKLTIPASTRSADMTTGGAADNSSLGEELYTIKAGDTLSKIAHAHGTTVKALETENNLTTTKINVGKKLKIPKKTEAAPAAPLDNTPAAPMVPPPAAPAAPSAAPGSTN